MRLFLNVFLPAVPAVAELSGGSNIFFQWQRVDTRGNSVDENHPYDTAVQLDPTSPPPFSFVDGAEETSLCLGIKDVDLFNARVGALAFLPLQENPNVPDANPRNGQDVLDNSERLFDDYSSLYIHRVGHYTGPLDIGNYLAIPHRNVSTIFRATIEASRFAVLDANTFLFNSIRDERWSHLDPDWESPQWFRDKYCTADGDCSDASFADVPPSLNVGRYQFEFYPCSAMVKTQIAEFPPFTLTQFVEAGRAPGAMAEMCKQTMATCTGENQQFLDYNDCMAYMNTLPHIDPICEHKYGGGSVQGNSFMCKYLHHFMAPVDPGMHCYHSGKGLIDGAGKRKCVPDDCMLESVEIVSGVVTQPTPQNLRPTWIVPAAEVPTIFVNDNGIVVETVADETMVPAQQVSRPVPAKFKLSTDCSAAEEDELAAVTVKALLVCLPSLASDKCSEKCVKALNLFYGRFNDNGAICRCLTSTKTYESNYVVRRSKVLSIFDVDPALLLNHCDPSAFKVNTCHDHPRLQKEPHSCPDGQYKTRMGCASFNYDRFVTQLTNDWSPARQLFGRTTQSFQVQSAEGIFFGVFETWRSDSYLYNLPPDSVTLTFVKRSPIAHYRRSSVERLTPYAPYLDEPHHVWSEVVASLQKPDGARNPVDDWAGSPFHFGYNIENDRSRMISIVHTTNSAQHIAARKMFSRFFPGVFDYGHVDDGYYKDKMAMEMRRRGYDNGGWEITDNSEMAKILRLALLRVVLNDNEHISNDEFESVFDPAGLSMFKVLAEPQMSRETGQLSSVNYLANRMRMIRLYRKIVPRERMRELVVQTGWWDAYVTNPYRGDYGTGKGRLPELSNDLDLDAAYDAMVQQTVNTGAVRRGFMDLVGRVRRDECEMMPLWNRYGPAKFAMESHRLSMASLAYADRKFLHHWASNVDETAFENPTQFDPGRHDFHKATTFNGLESDFMHNIDAVNYPNSTLQRPCPARGFSQRFIPEVAPLFFPKDAGKFCSSGNRVRCKDGKACKLSDDGVGFKSRLIAATYRHSDSRGDHHDHGLRVEVAKSKHPQIFVGSDALDAGDFYKNYISSNIEVASPIRVNKILNISHPCNCEDPLNEHFAWRIGAINDVDVDADNFEQMWFDLRSDFGELESVTFVSADAQVEVFNAEADHISAEASKLTIMLADFGEPPIVWAPTIARMQNHFSGIPLPAGNTINDAPGNTDMHYWAMALPGQGRGTPLANCSFNYTANLVQNIILHARQDLGYKNIFVMGRGIGGMLGWYLTQQADNYNYQNGEELLNAFVTFVPHPGAWGKGHANKKWDAYAKALVDPIASVYLGNPDAMEAIVFDKIDWDEYKPEEKEAWLWDYKRFWRQTGPDAMTCYHRDNFESERGHVYIKEDSLYPVAAQDISPKRTHVKLISFAFDPIYNAKDMFGTAASMILPQPPNGRLLDMYIIDARYGADNFFDTKVVYSVAQQSTVFMSLTNLISVWNLMGDILVFPTLMHPIHPASSTTMVISLVFVMLMVLVGIQLELLLGWKALKNGDRMRYRFCKIFSAITFYCTLSLGHFMFILLPFMILSLFDFGFPQLTALVTRPWRNISSLSKFAKWKSFFDGVGVLIHHSGAITVMVSVATERSPGMLFLFPGVPIMMEHILVSFDVFRGSANVFYQNGVLMLLLGLEVWLYFEIIYLYYAADVLGATGASMIVSGHVIWLVASICEIVHSMVTAHLESSKRVAELEKRDIEEAKQTGRSGRVRRRTAVSIHANAKETKNESLAVPGKYGLSPPRSPLPSSPRVSDIVSRQSNDSSAPVDTVALTVGLPGLLEDQTQITSMMEKLNYVMTFAEDEYDIMIEWQQYHEGLLHERTTQWQQLAHRAVGS